MLIYRSEMTVDESVTPEYLIRKTNEILSIYSSLPEDFWNSEFNSITLNSSGCSVDYIWLKDSGVIATFITYPRKDTGMVQEKTVLDCANQKIGVTLNYRKWQKSKTDKSVLIIPEILKALRKDQKNLTDNGLPVNQNPEMITTKRLALIKDIRERTVQPDLPVIYLTKRQDTGTFSIDPMTLAEMVNGEAHVYAEAQCERLASRWNIARNGFINVIYKNRFTFLNAKQKHYSAIGLSRKIVQYNWKNRNKDLTWEGVQKQLNQKRMDDILKESEESMELVEVSDLELKSKEQQIEELKEKLDKLYQEKVRLTEDNRILREKLKATDVTLLKWGNESDKYPDEIRMITLDILAKAKSQLKAGIRRYDILEDILKANGYDEQLVKLKDKIRTQLGKCGTIREFADNLAEIEGVPMETDFQTSHPKVRFKGDDRYMSTISATPSDHRTIKNTVSKVINTFF